MKKMRYLSLVMAIFVICTMLISCVAPAAESENTSSEGVSQESVLPSAAPSAQGSMDMPESSAQSTIQETKAPKVQCEFCGNWYEEGNVFRNHICSAQKNDEAQSEEPEMAQCEFCGNWYEAGNIFRNHICEGAQE